MLQQCASGWWYRRLPEVPQKSRREQVEGHCRNGERALETGENNPGAADNRAGVPAVEAVVAERVAPERRKQAPGADDPRGIPTADKAEVERTALNKEALVKHVLSGEKSQGSAKTLMPAFTKSKLLGPQHHDAETIQVSERPLPQSVKADARQSYDGEDRGAHEDESNPRSAKPVLPEPRVGREAFDPPGIRSSIRGAVRRPRSPQGVYAQLGGPETTRGKNNAEQGTSAGGSSLEVRSSAAEAFEVASTLSVSLPRSPDPVRHADFVNPTKLDGEGGKGCHRHGLEPCALCGTSNGTPVRSSGDRSMAPPFAERVQGGGPCDRHLLLDCILCKMLSPVSYGDGLSPISYGRTARHQHILGRSTSFPAFGSVTGVSSSGGPGSGGGDGGGGVEGTGAPDTAAHTVGSPSAYRCNKHDLLGCFLCGCGNQSLTAPRAGGSTDARHAEGEPAFSPAPQLVLPSPTLHGGGLQRVGAPPAGTFIDQPSRSIKGPAPGSGSGASEIDLAFGGCEGGNNGTSKKQDPELFGRTMLFSAPHPAGAAMKIDNNQRTFCDPPLGSDAARGVASFRGVGTRPPSNHQVTDTRVGHQRRNTNDGENTEPLSLAGGSTNRTLGRSFSNKMNHTARDDGKPTNRARRSKGTPVTRSVDAADESVRHGRHQRSRGRTPRRRRTLSKPFKPKPVGHDDPSTTSSRSSRGVRSSNSGDVVRGRAQASTVVSATRAREKMGDVDLAAKAITAALAVLQ